MLELMTIRLLPGSIPGLTHCGAAGFLLDLDPPSGDFLSSKFSVLSSPSRLSLPDSDASLSCSSSRALYRDRSRPDSTPPAGIRIKMMNRLKIQIKPMESGSKTGSESGIESGIKNQDHGAYQSLGVRTWLG